MRLALLLSIILTSAGLVGCDSKNNPLAADSFEPIEFEGELYILNSRTGEIFRVGEDAKLRLEFPSVAALRAANSENRLEFDDRFGRSSLVRIEGLAKIVAGTPRLRAQIEPFIEAINVHRDSSLFRLQALDADYFVIGGYTVNRSELTTSIVGGKPVGWSMNIELPFSPVDYQSVKHIEVVWQPIVDSSVEEWVKTEDGKAWQTKLLKEDAKLQPDNNCSSDMPDEEFLECILGSSDPNVVEDSDSAQDQG